LASRIRLQVAGIAIVLVAWLVFLVASSPPVQGECCFRGTFHYWLALPQGQDFVTAFELVSVIVLLYCSASIAITWFEDRRQERSEGEHK